MLLQQQRVLRGEVSLLVVFFLVRDIPDYAVHFGTWRRCQQSILPAIQNAFAAVGSSISKEFAFNTCTALAMPEIGPRSTKAWIWSSIPPMATAWIPWFFRIPDMYPHISLELFVDRAHAVLGAEHDVDVMTYVGIRHCAVPPGLGSLLDLPGTSVPGYRF
jgi:hypothetical protein